MHGLNHADRLLDSDIQFVMVCSQAKKLQDMFKAVQQENSHLKQKFSMGGGGGPARSMSPLGLSNRGGQMVSEWNQGVLMYILHACSTVLQVCVLSSSSCCHDADLTKAIRKEATDPQSTDIITAFCLPAFRSQQCTRLQSLEP